MILPQSLARVLPCLAAVANACRSHNSVLTNAQRSQVSNTITHYLAFSLLSPLQKSTSVNQGDRTTPFCVRPGGSFTYTGSSFFVGSSVCTPSSIYFRNSCVAGDFSAAQGHIGASIGGTWTAVALCRWLGGTQSHRALVNQQVVDSCLDPAEAWGVMGSCRHQSQSTLVRHSNRSTHSGSHTTPCQCHVNTKPGRATVNA